MAILIQHLHPAVRNLSRIPCLDYNQSSEQTGSSQKLLLTHEVLLAHSDPHLPCGLSVHSFMLHTVSECRLSTGTTALQSTSSVPWAWKEPPSDCCWWKARRSLRFTCSQALGPQTPGRLQKGPTWLPATTSCVLPRPGVRAPDSHQTNVEAPWLEAA